MREGFERRGTVCPCLGDVYERILDDSLQPAWKCDNCGRVTPRRYVSQPTNKAKALAGYLEIRKTWAPLDERLLALVESGKAMGGAILVHSSTWNHHLRKLMDLDKPTRFDVRYHIEHARADLASAESFITEREK